MTEGLLAMIALPLVAALTLAFTSWAEVHWVRDEPTKVPTELPERKPGR